MANVGTTAKDTNDFSREDSLSDQQQNIFRIILSWFVILFTIVFFPFVWILKELGRLFRFLGGGKEAKTRPLNYNEIAFIESVPIFLALTGVVLAIILGVVAWVGFSDQVQTFFNNLTNGLSGITQIVKDIFGGITFILSTLFGFLWETVTAIWEFVSSLFQDPFLVLVVLAAVLVVFFVIGSLIGELGLIRKLVTKLGEAAFGITYLPRVIYHRLEVLWHKVLKSFGRFVVGGESVITSRSKGFYQRILWLVTLYTLWTFVWGILLLGLRLADPTQAAIIRENQAELFNAVLFILFVLLFSGFMAGTVLMLILVRVLNKMSSNKEEYVLTKEVVETARKQSLVDYMSSKSIFPAIKVATVSKIVDVDKKEIESFFKLKSLSDWKVYSSYIVNDKLFKQKMDKINALVDQGLEEENQDFLANAIDDLDKLSKSVFAVPELRLELQEKSIILDEDYKDLSGILDEEEN